ncbi:MAG TPA: peptide deformylase [Candidatus Latescibacteria bacterium]|nr:peptide deformylase [Candidatus Latescibacterota bacterium]
MSILKVSQMGHPVLRRVADPVDRDQISSEAFRRLIRDLRETMVAYQGAGLAAPQVHVSNRILVYKSQDVDEVPEITALINPKVEPVDRDMEEEWEGCLSIPRIMGLVPRYRRIRVTAVDEGGEDLSFVSEDFEARVIQHEVDHLDGILYFDRMDDLKALTFRDEHAMFWAEHGEESDGEETS